MMLEKFIERSHVNLLQPTSKIPLAYLISRGITLDEIKKYKLGYTPVAFENFSEKDHDEAGNFNKWLGTRGKFVKNRLLFPIYDELGEVKGIETRALDRKSMDILKPNYKITLKDLIAKLPETEVRYKKFYLEKTKFSSIFFGLPEALEEVWNTRTVFLTEGIFDLLTLRKIKSNSLTPLTANINSYQIAWLRRYVDNVILLFDPDAKGKEASIKLKEELEKQGIRVHSVPVLGKDVNDYVVNKGLTDFRYYLEDKLDTLF